MIKHKTFAHLLGIVFVMSFASFAYAQSEESLSPPAPGEFEAAPGSSPEKAYAVPDVPEKFADKLQIKRKGFTLIPGLVLLFDYNSFHQDEDSVFQVGEQENKWDPRAVRLMLRGSMGDEYKVGYLFAAEYKGFESDPEDLWSLTDLSFTFPLGSPATKLTIGKTKETFSYEMVGDAASLPQQERVLNPFFVSRNVGVRLSHVIPSQRMTISGGVYNDWFVQGQNFSDSGTDATVRITGLLWDKNEGKRFLHLGIAGRYAGADSDTMRYRARPESDVADYYLDSGSLSGDHALHLGLEALWNEGPFSILAEYAHAWVNAPQAGDPEFYGYYVTASWIVTGETRPYDRTTGYARRIIPKGKWGALELVARFSHEDVEDGIVQGGTFDKTYVGINWWATKRAKIGVGWGHTWLDRLDSSGKTDLEGETDHIQTRLQWVF